MKMQEKGVCKSTKRKREGLKGAFIKIRRPKNRLEGTGINMAMEIGNCSQRR